MTIGNNMMYRYELENSPVMKPSLSLSDFCLICVLLSVVEILTVCWNCSYHLPFISRMDTYLPSPFHSTMNVTFTLSFTERLELRVKKASKRYRLSFFSSSSTFLTVFSMISSSCPTYSLFSTWKQYSSSHLRKDCTCMLLYMK